ncbi:von Willebrand factor type A domain protein [Maioricimonas rarisocia]|uniref:von Willebrand factor type A domain protein n=1 Tax=Maioricimonas rarisocia TaxID=2528026 RepID=A0A517ZDT7_9PLAN|nr:VWA domain-containing protein [Maioricimonas rarisocia]QDU40610.1 von Willebrand factor type A domain protein [Maioricimonas rarisocia]
MVTSVRHDRDSYGAIAASMGMHIVLLSMLAMFAYAPREDQDTLLVQTEWAETSSSANLDEPLPMEVETPTEDGGGSHIGDVVTALASDVPDPNPFVDQSLVAPIDTAGSTPDLFSLREKVSLSGGGGAGRVQGSGSGQGTGNGAGDEEGSSFFGLNAPGKKFVFVVDGSGSMNRPFPGPAKTRFGRVKLELIRTVQQMNEEQQFFIIFFNDNAIPMPATRLMEAVPSAQYNYLRWMTAVEATGMTEPESALMLALRLQPDVIYFLTDGAFKYRVIERVRKANRGRVSIHTIGFGDDEAEDFMKQIASQNFGSYQFIPADYDEAGEEGPDDAGSRPSTASAPAASAAQ